MLPRCVVTALATSSLPALLCACPGFDRPGGGDIPVTDSCAEPSTPTVDTLELGTGPRDSQFLAWEDGDSIELQYGPQGGTMIAARVRLAGSDTSCIAQHTVVSLVDGTTLIDDSQPLRMYRQDDGSITSGVYWLIFDFMDPQESTHLTLETTVGELSVNRSLWVGKPYTGPSLAEMTPASVELERLQLIPITLTLSAPAVSDTLVMLHTSDYRIAWPDTTWLTVPAGATSATFHIQANMDSGQVEIHALLGTEWRSVTATVGSAGM